MSDARRVLLAGFGSSLSPPVLRALLASRHEVVGLATPAPVRPPWGHVLMPCDVVDAARAAGVAVHGVARGEDPRPLLDQCRPDVVVVACVPWRLPAAWWERPPLGALNVHPSLLPRWRGPSPLFWQYRAGDMDTGVTVHHLTSTLDAGPIASREAVPLADDLDLQSAEQTLGAAGGRLVVRLLESAPLPRQPQGDGGSQQGWPDADSQALPLDLSARHAYRFVKLVGGVVPVRAGDLCLRDARGWSAEPPPDGLTGVRCRDGWLVLGPRDAHRVGRST